MCFDDVFIMPQTTITLEKSSGNCVSLCFAFSMVKKYNFKKL